MKRSAMLAIWIAVVVADWNGRAIIMAWRVRWQRGMPDGWLNIVANLIEIIDDCNGACISILAWPIIVINRR